ncbi:tetratricopeptide repeat protein [Chitinimonas sp. BJYL2]|uniref:tetratricopeptide repeat protein n=1 Tax=Chitinimonas sp. BJYL2 TaxID=2976696 RepID=UPI0022B31626|nr:tetratricopeptide repeat protein [Chitinimonas sp. BJYL2]
MQAPVFSLIHLNRLPLRALMSLALLLLLSACASHRPPDIPREILFQDAHFTPAAVPSAASLFEPSAAMQRFVDTELRVGAQKKGPARALMDALYRQGNLRINYDAAQTRGAAETFAEGAGNCLSLAVMTAALAKQVGLPVIYHEVHIARGTWSRTQNTLFRIGHVNVTIGYTDLVRTSRFALDPALTVDFTPQDLRGERNRDDIPESRILAMFYNNRAAELMVAGRTNEAYWHAREAIRQDPGFEASYNTLGVIYNRHGLMDAAERLYASLLQRHADDPTVLSNLLLVLNKQGKTAEAASIEARLARLDKDTPFKSLMQGQTALANQQYTEAISHFQRELQRDPDYHETHLGLALAYYHLGRLSLARSHMSKAQANAETGADRIRYAAKLARLVQVQPVPGG